MIATLCLICDAPVPISEFERSPKICDKCKAAVLKVRVEMGEVDCVEVVRCKDCQMGREKHLGRERQLNIYWCDKWRNIMRGHDFCSFGERRKQWSD